MPKESTSFACPDCGGSSLTLNGRTPAGKQKYKCRNPECRRHFVKESTHLTKAVKDTISRMLNAGFSPSCIQVAVPDVSLRWIYEIRRGMK